MSNIMDLRTDYDNRMPFVRFERIAIEDKAATLEAGHYVAKDMDMANITPPYSKDVMKYYVPNWFEQLKADVQNQRIPEEWVEKYKRAYEAFKNGQELPLDGIPIRGWGVISPAQQETLIKMHVLTVEQLSEITYEGIQRVGMGGQDLKNKAVAWLKSLKKSGAVTIENAALLQKVEQQTATINTLENKVKELTRMIENSDIYMPQEMGVSARGQKIDIESLLED